MERGRVAHRAWCPRRGGGLIGDVRSDHRVRRGDRAQSIGGKRRAVAHRRPMDPFHRAERRGYGLVGGVPAVSRRSGRVSFRPVVFGVTVVEGGAGHSTATGASGTKRTNHQQDGTQDEGGIDQGDLYRHMAEEVSHVSVIRHRRGRTSPQSKILRPGPHVGGARASAIWLQCWVAACCLSWPTKQPAVHSIHATRSVQSGQLRRFTRVRRRSTSPGGDGR